MSVNCSKTTVAGLQKRLKELRLGYESAKTMTDEAIKEWLNNYLLNIRRFNIISRIKIKVGGTTNGKRADTGVMGQYEIPA